MSQTSPPMPLFEQRATVTLRRAEEVFRERGGQYGDTWGNCAFLTLRAVARHLGCAIPEDAFRALATAAFCDMKHQRMEGGYKEDNLEDGINYAAFLAEEVRAVMAGRAQAQLPHLAIQSLTGIPCMAQDDVEPFAPETKEEARAYTVAARNVLEHLNPSLRNAKTNGQ